MPTDPMPCPACQTPMTAGTVEIHGNSLGFLLVGLSWQELYFKAGDGADEESLLTPNEIHPAYRCPACRLTVIAPERMPSAATLRADATDASECLACGAALQPGVTRCARCGWTYKNPEPRKPA